MQESKSFLSPQKFSQETGLGIHLVRTWAKEGAIRCIRVGKHIKILASELVDFPVRAAENNLTK